MSFTWYNSFNNQTLTRNNFITNFRTRIDEENPDTIQNAQIEEFIKQGNYDISFRTGILPDYATATLNGSSNYTLPSDMNELYEIIYVSADSPKQYTLVSPTNLVQLQENGYSLDRVSYYVRNGQSIEIFGNSVNIGSLRAYGSRIPTYPVTGLNYIDLPDQYIELMYLWCEWKFWVKRREPDEATIARNSYLDLTQKAKEQITKQFSRGGTYS